MLGSFSEAFLAGDPRAEPFLPRDFVSREKRSACVQRARERRCPLLPAGQVAVVTGQQIGLFLGPLYCVYKAATAIACARALEQETGVRCVPVFWLQTEDHDTAEIDHVWVGAQKLHVPIRLEPRCSVQHAVLGEEVTAALARLPDPTLWAKHYRPGARWVDAFSGVLRELFPTLLLVNPCEHEVPAVHQRALTEADRHAKLLEQRSAALEAAGFKVQVPVKPGAPLSFHHPEGPAGPRHRLNAGDRPTKGHFSTSALLRPIVQDTLLPTAAIVGGPGELNYFAQMSVLYEAYGIPMPMLVPRARFRVIDVATRRLLEKLGLKPADAETPNLLSKLQKPVEPSPEALEQQLVAAADQALTHVPLPDVVTRTRGTIARAASRMAGRYRKHLETADTVLTDRVQKLQAALYPNGEPQERVQGLPAYPGLNVHPEPWNPAVKDLEFPLPGGGEGQGEGPSAP